MSVTEEIKSRLDIVQFLSQYLNLRKAGRNYTALCPFHNEKTPTFIVFPETQNWRCFGACGEGGDIFNFVMKREGLDFPGALRVLAERAGIELHERTECDLSIIIVSWNVRDYLRACLDSIRPHSDSLSLEVVVVDSGSNDGTPDLVRREYPEVTLLAQVENVGFTRGNNIGLAAAKGRHLFLLNPDTEIVNDALAQMVRYLDAHPAVGIIGPHTLNTDGSTQSSKRRFPTLQTAIFESTWLQSLAPRAVLDRFYARDIGDTDTAQVDWVQGSALMLRREVYQQIGGLDEAYVMYSEEMDFCKRAKDAGWQVVYLGSATITHHGGKSSEQVTAFKHIQFQRSKIRYFGKFHGPLAAGALRVVLLLNYVGQLALEGIKGVLGFRRAMRAERVKVYWQVIRSLAQPG